MFDTSFRSFFSKASDQIILENSEGVIQHLTHLEELILTQKDEGLSTAINFLNELYSTFKGNSQSQTFVTIKFDGAPSCIAGYNPENKQFFVSTKSISNVNPKINYNEEDVQKNHGHAPGLSEKLKQALKYLPAVIKEGVYQGDFLFSREDLTEQNIDGEDLILFKPNTITYAIPLHSSLGQRIKQTKMGIIFHTKYSGSNLQNLTKSSDVSVSEFNLTPDVFVDDAKFKDISGFATFTDKESVNMEKLLRKANRIGKKINWNSVAEQNYLHLNTYINSLIKEGRFIEDPIAEYDKFILWVTSKGQKAIDELKTEKGKAQKQETLNKYLAGINFNKLNIINLLMLSVILEQAKRIFIEKYNAAIRTKQFITEPDGSLKVTNPEGYVAIDHKGNMVKFVDRMEFSRANFAVSKGDKFK